jgi:hypothetical protein
MNSPILHAAAWLAAATPAPTPTDGTITPSSINFDGLKNVALFGFLPLIGIFIGLVIIMRSRGGDMNRAATTTGISMLGLMFIGASTVLAGVGLGMSGLIFK